MIDKHFSAAVTAVPVKNMLQMFRFPAFVDAQASGSMDYNIQDKEGDTKLALQEFRLASNKVTKSLELVILKDPSSIVFGETSLDAKIHDDEISYTLVAKAMDASITVDEAIIDKEKDTHAAKIAFGYNKYAIEGSVKGSVRHPRIGFDTKGLIPDIDFADKAERKIEKFFKRLF